jgi:hypothetical protein
MADVAPVKTTTAIRAADGARMSTSQKSKSRELARKCTPKLAGGSIRTNPSRWRHTVGVCLTFFRASQHDPRVGSALGMSISHAHACIATVRYVLTDAASSLQSSFVRQGPGYPAQPFATTATRNDGWAIPLTSSPLLRTWARMGAFHRCENPSVSVCMKLTSAFSSSSERPRRPMNLVFMLAVDSGAGQHVMPSPGSFTLQRGRTSRVL